MNRSSEILDYLSKAETSRMVILAPNAPPVGRGMDGVSVAMNVVLDAADIIDTLIALQGKTTKTEPDIYSSNAGTFSFGLRDIGRVRVTYATQRGSKVASVCLVPFLVPDIHQLCDSPDIVKKLSRAVLCENGALVTVSGQNLAASNSLVYGLLREINLNKRWLIYVLERYLTYLMAHGDCIVIQSELGEDIPDIEEGLAGCFNFHPDAIFVGDVRPTDSFPSITHSAASGIVTILSSTSMSGSVMAARALQNNAPGSPLCMHVQVTPLQDGKLKVEECG